MRRRKKPWITPLVMVPLFGDAGNVALFKSMLDSADIKYAVNSDIMQDFFGLGRMGIGYNLDCTRFDGHL